MYKGSEKDKLKYIQKCLSEGRTREETARSLGYRNWRGLDIYMRRKGFSWSSLTNSYYEKMEKCSSLSHKDLFASSKVSGIIARFSLPDADPMGIALDLGFADNREMASYMQARGYKWSIPHNNYIFSPAVCTVTAPSPASGGETPTQNAGSSSPTLASVSPPADTCSAAFNLNRPASGPCASHDVQSAAPDKYADILEFLNANRSRLLSMLSSREDSGTIPRYIVPGITRTKSFYMSDVLSELVAEYSRSRNISQKEIVETALIEFLRKYSFKNEVDAVLKGQASGSSSKFA